MFIEASWFSLTKHFSYDELLFWYDKLDTVDTRLLFNLLFCFSGSFFKIFFALLTWYCYMFLLCVLLAYIPMRLI